MNNAKPLCFILVCLFFACTVNGQKKRTFKVNPGQQVTKTIPMDVIYTYPEFRLGNVQFKNGRVGVARMNYNSLIIAMEFITDNGDTLTLDDLNTIHYIAIATDTFYCEQGFLLLWSNVNNVKLAEKRVIMMSNREKIGGFGEINGGSVETKDQLSSSGNPLQTMVAKEILTFTENLTWYFGDRFNHFKQASKKNILDLFGRFKPGLEDYLNDNHLNYFNEEDMKKLAIFLQK